MLACLEEFDFVDGGEAIQGQRMRVLTLADEGVVVGIFNQEFRAARSEFAKLRLVPGDF